MSGEHDREYASFGLVMPFVVCQSQGGPFEDEAFVSGWRCGEVDRTLCTAEGLLAKFLWTVRAEELPQLDLIAMHRGFVIDRLLAGEQEQETGWCVVEFRRPESSDSAGEERTRS